MENNNITINIPYKSHMANIITCYAATFDNIKNYICDGFTKENNEYILDLKIPFGRKI